MKKINLLIFFLALTILPVLAQQGKITGKVTDETTGLPVSQVTVRLNDKVTVTGEDGLFTLDYEKSGKLVLIFEKNTFEPYSMPVDPDGSTYNSGEIKLRQMSTMTSDMGLADMTLNNLEGDDENKGQTGSGLLSASADVFSSTAAYIFGPVFFRTRGYDNENQAVYMNGLQVNDMENGRASWSDWGGLNDVTRNKETSTGLGLAPFTFGSLGGSTNIITRASLQRKQTKFSYAFSNRTYVHRTMFTYSTGLMKNNWAFTVSASRRWGQEGYIDASSYDANAYFIGVEKKLNEKHSIALTVYGAPTKRGQQAASTQEVYDLSGSNYYNSNWGLQDGEKRNSRMKEFHQPMFMLNHYAKLSKKLQWNNGASYTFGRDGGTALNWYNSSDPRPDYYRYLPSYVLDDPNSDVDELTREAITNRWKTNINYRQINWNNLYQTNYLANMVGKSARYIIEDRRNDQAQLNLSSSLKYDFAENIKITGGAQFIGYSGYHFKTVSDLLGSEYWLDVDQFAERDFIGDTARRQTDLNNPNRKVVVGDKFGYNYNMHSNTAMAWAQSEYTTDRIDYSLGLSFTHQEYWREGLMKNGNHPDNSFGVSEKHKFNDIGVKAGATYKITGRHFVVANGMYMTRAPFIRNIYISPRVRDDVAPGITSEKILSGEISYMMRYPGANLRFTAYHTEFKDQTEINSFYHDDYKTFVNHVMTGINKTHQGVEFGAEVKVIGGLSVQGVAALGNYRYTNRPTGTISYDNGSKADTTETIYIKNFYVPGAQTATSLGLKYAGPGYLFINLNANYFDNAYLDFNPERRTSAAIKGLGTGDPLIEVITQQEKLPSAFTMDLSIGKSWRFGEYYLNLNFSVSNILDNQDFVTGGYEQMRFDYVTKDVDKFPSKYYYSFGRTYYLNLGFRF